MQELPSSNMASKHYCPNCESFNLKRLQRGYFKRVILNHPIKFICRECHTEITESIILKNEVKDVPVFISQS